MMMLVLILNKLFNIWKMVGNGLISPETEILSMAYLIQGEIYSSLADMDEVVFGEQSVYIEYVNRAKNAFKKGNLIDKGSVEYSGPLREWQWDQQIEQSINESLSTASSKICSNKRDV